MNEILYWNFSIRDERTSAIEMRDKSAIAYNKKVLSTKKGFKKSTQGFRYDCLKMVKDIISREISGTVMEIGAGTAIASCYLSKYKGVEKIFALEYSKICVEELIPFTIKRFNLTESEENKIFPVVGSFNDIKLPDNSLDFIVGMGVLHHSEDREKTLKELYRVLKVGGYLIAVDKASFNTYTNKMLNDLLDIEYDLSFKKNYGHDVNKKYTRRMNSEHNPILAEWEYLITKCGFKTMIFWFQFFQGLFGILWHWIGKIFFKIFGNRMLKKNLTQYYHMKIPYFPWFTKDKDLPENMLIVAKKLPYIEMP